MTPDPRSFAAACLRTLVLPVVGILGLWLLRGWLLERGIEQGLLWLAVWLALLGFEVRFAVTLHRLLLLGPGSVAGWGLAWSGREGRYLGCCVVAYLLAAAAGSGAALVVGLPLSIVDLDQQPWARIAMTLVVVSPMLYLLARWSLLFPALAIDRRCDLGTAWQWSRGRGIRLLMCVVVPPATVGFAGPVVLKQADSLGASILVGLCTAIALAFAVVLVTRAYRLVAPTARVPHAPRVAVPA
jgi:hypothetical protein